MAAIRAWLGGGDRSAFQAEVKQLIFKNDTPIIVSEDNETFALVMRTFQQYENSVSTCNNVSELIVFCIAI